MSLHGKHMEALQAGMVETSDGIVEGNKSEVIFSVKNTPGALRDVLKLFHDYHVNLSRIESLPAKLR